ncbi:MAG: hypothetical protein AAF975_06750 [Spirochaetota bacterium]
MLTLLFLPYLLLSNPDSLKDYQLFPLLLPGLLSHFRHIQTYRFRPYIHFIGHAMLVSACVAVLYLAATKSPAPVSAHLQEPAHLQEQYILSSEQTGRKLLTWQGGGSFYVQDSSGTVLRNSRRSFQRPLTQAEITVLKQLEKNLFSHDHSQIGPHYSSLVELQTEFPLTYVGAKVEDPELLFSNFPISSAGLLVIGSYPPPDLRIELLSTGESSRIFYRIGLEAGTIKDDPLSGLLALLSTVETSGERFRHSVQVSGLRLELR